MKPNFETAEGRAAIRDEDGLSDVAYAYLMRALDALDARDESDTYYVQVGRTNYWRERALGYERILRLIANAKMEGSYARQLAQKALAESRPC